MKVLAAGLLLATVLSAADLTGIWMGEVAGRNGEKQDLAFEFRMAKGALTGVLFGDEFDLPVQDLHVDGDHVAFSVSSVDYYGARRIKTLYTGTLTDTKLELTREQSGPEPAATAAKPKEPKQTIVLKKLASPG
ncbi:MAG: hypothetical protein M3N54_08070 [Acidobacteriota bacterium]|nr:hypothetical protein [Acidobacteriota bacterium]